MFQFVAGLTLMVIAHSFYRQRVERRCSSRFGVAHLPIQLADLWTRAFSLQFKGDRNSRVLGKVYSSLSISLSIQPFKTVDTIIDCGL